LKDYISHTDVYDFFVTGAIFVSLTFASLLWFGKSRLRPANRFLAGLLLIGALWRWLPIQFLFAPGPLIYFYVLKMTRLAYKFRPKDLWHFSPLLLGLAFQTLIPFLYLLLFASVIFYLYYCHALIGKFYRRLEFNDGDRNLNQLCWLHNLLKISGLLLLLRILVSATDYFLFHGRLNVPAYYLLNLSLMTTIIWIGAKAHLISTPGAGPTTIPALKPLLPAELKQKGKWLKNEVKENGYYLDPDLSLNSLAEKLGMHSHELSRIVNAVLKKSFSDFINEYRVRDITRKMQDPAFERLTLLGIAFESGFNSRTNFHRTFKQMTGKSPADYKAMLKKEIPYYNPEHISAPPAVIWRHETVPIWSCEQLNRNYMFKNYLKTAWRNLVKDKVFSFINILGLSIGIAVCMMIFLFIMNEFSFDRFHKQGDRIYRVTRGFNENGKESYVSYLSWPYGPALLNDFKSEILKAVRVNPNDDLVKANNKSFHEMHVLDVDSDFFSLFSFPLLRGDAAGVLKQPNNVVLTETTAKKYFGNIDDAMGKTILMDKTLSLKVTGIAKDVPSDSHLTFDVVIPLQTPKTTPTTSQWISNGLFTYVLLGKNVSAQNVQRRLPQFVGKYLAEAANKYGYKVTLSLVPLKDVYFENIKFDGGDIRHGEKTVVYIFISIAAFILLIACINFMNLSTIRAVDRSKEVGLRKVLGALRNNLVRQFIGESVLMAAISCALAVGLMLLAMPWYNQLLGYTLTVPWTSWPVYVFLAGVILVVGFLAGSYPALFMSAFSPIQALKGKLKLGKGGAMFRQGLVVVQFSISILLIVGTLIITRQMSYVKNKQLGYDKEQTLLVRIDNNDIFNHMQSFKTNLQNSGEVRSVSLMSGEPGGFFDTQLFDVEGQTGKWSANTEYADFQFVPTFGLKIVAGRDLSPQFPSDTLQAVLLNRTAAAKLGWTPQQALGRWIRNSFRDSLRRYVVGVVEDFNFLSLKQGMAPLVISPAPDRRVIAIKLRAGHVEGGIEATRQEYMRQAGAYPFEYRFLDEQFGKLYQTDIRQQTILTVFAGLAIFVACLGLFGLASFAATKRFKEIGVRKVLGSSVRSIVVLLSRDLLKPVLISALIALPAGYYAMNKWLEGFAYKTTLSWWIFALAAVITFAIALITVSIKAIKAALASPVKSLRSE
jgi:putative ABC transport system permease protein